MISKSSLHESLTSGDLSSEFIIKQLPKRIFRYQPMYFIKTRKEKLIQISRHSIELDQETLSRFQVKRIEANRWKVVANVWDKNLVTLKKVMRSARTKRIFQFSYDRSM